MIEIPVVAEGGLTKEVVNDLENITDFLAFGVELWNKENPLNELNHLLGLPQ
jgi:thiamine-phosphate pyrophosphorylase